MSIVRCRFLPALGGSKARERTAWPPAVISRVSCPGSAVKVALVAALDADLADDALTLVVVDEALAGQALLVGLGQGADVAEDVAATLPSG